MRTLPSTITTAVAKDFTSPLYLVRINFGAAENKIACWDTDITWNGETWLSSGVEVSNLTKTGGALLFPANDSWLGIFLGAASTVRGAPISVYQHYTDATASPQADAVLIFTGVLDQTVMTDSIRVTVVESSQAKGFPAKSIDVPEFNYLLKSGDRFEWAGDTVVVT